MLPLIVREAAAGLGLSGKELKRLERLECIRRAATNVVAVYRKGGVPRAEDVKIVLRSSLMELEKQLKGKRKPFWLVPEVAEANIIVKGLLDPSTRKDTIDELRGIVKVLSKVSGRKTFILSTMMGQIAAFCLAVHGMAIINLLGEEKAVRFNEKVLRMMDTLEAGEAERRSNRARLEREKEGPVH
jgi:hypothetical protein